MSQMLQCPFLHLIFCLQKKMPTLCGSVSKQYFKGLFSYFDWTVSTVKVKFSFEKADKQSHSHQYHRAQGQKEHALLCAHVRWNIFAPPSHYSHLQQCVFLSSLDIRCRPQP